jgi:predicted O-methyltransferase YrrM
MEGDMDIVDPLIDEYLGRLVGSPDPVEAEMRRYADEREGFPHVGPLVGAFLQQLALVTQARRVFEVGSGFGYSAFWFARGLAPGGTVTLTDWSRDNLDRARDYLGRAGLQDRCRFEPAGDGHAALEREGPGLDLIFFDQEKADYPRGLALALPKLRPGGLIIADNVLWGGAVARGENDPATAGLREFLRLVHGSEGLVSTVLPLRDGLSLTWKR